MKNCQTLGSGSVRDPEKKGIPKNLSSEVFPSFRQSSDELLVWILAKP